MTIWEWKTMGGDQERDLRAYLCAKVRVENPLTWLREVIQ